MRTILTSIALVGALALASAAFAGNGSGLSARLARLDVRVATYHQKCDVANPAAKCALRKEKLTAKLTRVEANLDARIAKHHKPARLALLQSARDHVAALLASLS